MWTKRSGIGVNEFLSFYRVEHLHRTILWLCLVCVMGLLATRAYASPSDDGSAIMAAQFMRCDDARLNEEQLQALDAQLQRLFDDEHAEIDEALRRAHRSARLPEVIRVQTGARVDRDQQNRKRLTEDFDEVGAIRRSVLEDRDTYQDDAYIQVTLSAEWRLTRTRWSSNEIALRKERTTLRKEQRSRQEALTKHWFSLLRTHMTWCDYWRQYAASGLEPEGYQAVYQRTIINMWEELRMLDLLTEGTFLDLAQSLLDEDEVSPDDE